MPSPTLLLHVLAQAPELLLLPLHLVLSQLAMLFHLLPQALSQKQQVRAHQPSDAHTCASTRAAVTPTKLPNAH
jgi:hypothetical protein